MRGYMPQRVFEFGACFGAVAQLEAGEPIESAVARITAEYRQSFIDDDFEQDWITGAQMALKAVNDLPVGVQSSLLQDFQFFTRRYDQRGRRRRRSFFSGAWFTKEPEPNPRRVEDFIHRLHKYIDLVRNGELPAEWRRP